MRRLPLYVRPTWMLATGLVLMLIIAVGAAVSTLEVQNQHRRTLLIFDYMDALDHIQVAMLQIQTGQRGYLITGEERDLAPYEEGRQTVAAALTELARFDPLAMGLPKPKVPIARLVAENVAELDRTLALLRGSHADAPILELPPTPDLQHRAGGEIVTPLRDELTGMRLFASSRVNQEEETIDFEAYTGVGLIVTGLLLSGGLAATSDVMLRREIIVRQTVESVLLEHQADLARSNNELEQFAHIASHDLQEPLRMISSYTQLLGRRYADKLGADAKEFIAYAVDGAKRMQILINDLLNFSRVTSEAKPLEPVDLEAAFSDTLKDLEFRIEDCGAMVTHDPLPTVQADPVQIRRLLLNLVANGMKFHALDRQPTVNVSATREGQQWRFGVCDNGIGIDAQYFANLFQIFKRLHSHEEYPGTGIGLAVCKKIVERHGGRIWVESVLGLGSTFLFTLPVLETQS